jgi:hypothetical protein
MTVEGLDKNIVARFEVADIKDAQSKAKQLGIVEPPGESLASVQKRKANGHDDTSAPQELDSIKAKLVAKKRKSQRTKS